MDSSTSPPNSVPRYPHSTSIPFPTQVSRLSLDAIAPVLAKLLDRSDLVFLSLDTEFSGMGTGPGSSVFREKNIQERYKQIRGIVMGHGLVGLGLTVVLRDTGDRASNHGAHTLQPEDEDSNGIDFSVHNFEFLTLREDSHLISPSSAAFLATHGHDFNRQFILGIPYLPGDDGVAHAHAHQEMAGRKGGAVPPKPPPPPTPNLSTPLHPLRMLVMRLLRAAHARHVPIVFHNGILDLMFLHHHLYASLPRTLEEFAGDLAEAAGGGGWWDTKYVAEYGETEDSLDLGSKAGADLGKSWEREESSFLGFLFRKYERLNTRRRHLRLPFLRFHVAEPLAPPPPPPTPIPPPPVQHTEIASASSGPKNLRDLPYCASYAHHGFCKDGRACQKSHDLDVAMDWDEEKRKVPRLEDIEPESLDAPGKKMAPQTGSKRSRSTAPESVVKRPRLADNWAVSTSDDADASARVHPTSAHSAALDSYMTAFVFAFQRLLHCTPGAPVSKTWDPNDLPSGWDKYRNKVYLSGKDQPLLLRRGALGKSGEGHREKWKHWGNWATSVTMSGV
ncbi:hypothetical protein M427DRAFT_142370 [Gonapodya prolifera JEL478]|uniref:C3H1-type domain-containing protein n=1 Tax=Gonapodya prolifera (strain JEL478) TaxID=1344416 RepID=A0A139AXP7_GONPJ|nr:hypothetical protein M427DRAFT_142370 [Gonapodya prolifera JEL478]|eukprot:KXS21225.1 hypothetical protein M427DRAFT_142370 [Gonapodya prolifera JEL478]